MTNRKRILFSTFFLDGAPPVRQGYRAPHGQVLTEYAVKALLRARLAEAESFFPGRRFVPVRLRDGNFSLVEQKK